jgi:hypothetical protein
MHDPHRRFANVVIEETIKVHSKKRRRKIGC